MTRIILIVAVLAGTASCASNYKLPAGRPAAEIVFASETDSTRTTMVSTWGVAFADESCSASRYGLRLGDDSGKPVRINAYETFTFAANYVEERLGENRSCAVLASFTPLQNRRYLAKMSVTGQVKNCDVAVYDITRGREVAVPLHVPADFCGRQLNGATFRSRTGPVKVVSP